MTKLIAVERIAHSVGEIPAGAPFETDERHAQRLIAKGQALTPLDYKQRAWNGRGYWHITPDWQGETVAIIAGGPSVSQIQVRETKGCKIIAINNSLSLAPWADLLYFCDARWYEWNLNQVHEYPGRIVTLENLTLQNRIKVRCLRDYGVEGWAPSNDGITNGRNSGYQALHLAAWLGAKRVLLLGYDMQAGEGRMHWHDEHRVPTPANIFPGWLACFNSLAPELEKRGVEVINCSKGSALTVFPQMTVAEALAPRVAVNATPVDEPQASLSVADDPQPPPDPPPLYLPLKTEPAQAGFFSPAGLADEGSPNV